MIKTMPMQNFSLGAVGGAERAKCIWLTPLGFQDDVSSEWPGTPVAYQQSFAIVKSVVKVSRVTGASAADAFRVVFTRRRGSEQ